MSFPISYDLPVLRVEKFLVSDCVIDKKLTVCHGVKYHFLASLFDVSTIPQLPFTSVIVGVLYGEHEPKVWRSNTVSRDFVIELESVSDAGTKSMQDEARSCWAQFKHDIKKKIQWMNLIGIHKDIQDRMLSPLTVRRVEIRTLQDDMLARMFACGTAEIARIAETLHHIEQETAKEPGLISSKEFFWSSRDEEVPSWAAKRYADAMNNNYQTISTTFADKD